MDTKLRPVLGGEARTLQESRCFTVTAKAIYAMGFAGGTPLGIPMRFLKATVIGRLQESHGFRL
jgi:hypothetical protein